MVEIQIAFETLATTAVADVGVSIVVVVVFVINLLDFASVGATLPLRCQTILMCLLVANFLPLFIVSLVPR